MQTTLRSTGAPGPSFARATVRDAMHPWVLTCDPATPLVTVAQRMAGERIHAVVVLTSEDRRPWGVVTDAILLRRAAQADELTAGEVATREIVEARPDDALADAAARMARMAATHALVVDPRTGHPIGVLSSLDVARVLGWGHP